jgi:chromosome segregation ATPase
MAGEAQQVEKRVDQALERVWSELNQLRQQVAELMAAVKYPNPELCAQRQTIADLKSENIKLRERVDTLESWADRARGGWAVVLFLISGGMVSIAGLVYALYTVAKLAK